MIRTAVYAGTFDPFTFGHLWMVETGAKLFDTLVVAIGENPGKIPMFTTNDRLALIRECTSHLSNIQVTSFPQQYLIAYARDVGAQYIVRGIRSLQDYEYESAMLDINRDIGDGIETVILIPPVQLARVSSSMVKGLIGPDGWESVVSKYVPPVVLAKFKEAAHD